MSSARIPNDEQSATARARGLMVSFRAAANGVLRTIANQRNMKIHMIAGLMVFVVAMTLPLSLDTRVALLFAVAIVLFAEILNTAVESMIDLYIRDFHRLALVAKDAAAAGVLILAVTTVIVLAEVLWHNWDLVETNLPAVQRSIVLGGGLVISEIVGLFVMRRGAMSAIRLLLSLGLAFALAWFSADPIFSLLTVLFVIVNAIARHTFPKAVPISSTISSHLPSQVD